MRKLVGSLLLGCALALPACASDDYDPLGPLIVIPGWTDATFDLQLNREYEFHVDEIDLDVGRFDPEEGFIRATIVNSGPAQAGPLRVQARVRHMTLRGGNVLSSAVQEIMVQPTGVDDDGNQVYEDIELWTVAFEQGAGFVVVDVFADAAEPSERGWAFYGDVGDYLEPIETNNGLRQRFRWVAASGSGAAYERGTAGSWSARAADVIDTYGHLHLDRDD